MADARSRLLFKFWSGTHGLNEELGIGIEVGKVIKNVSCVVMSVRVSVSPILHYQYDCIYYVAPPVKMGAWSITCVLRQQIYYY